MKCARVALACLLLCPLARATAAEPASPAQRPALVAVCAGCHGEDGRSASMPAWGRIAGQHYEYLVYALKLYRAGGRNGLNAGLMASYVRGLSDAQIEALARYYSRLSERAPAMR